MNRKIQRSDFRMKFFSVVYLGATDCQTILTHTALFRDYGHRHLLLVHFSDRQSVACCTTKSVSAKQLYLLSCCISLLLRSFWLHSLWRKDRNRTKNWMHQSHYYEITSGYFVTNRKFVFATWNRKGKKPKLCLCFCCAAQEIRKCSVIGSIAHMFIVRCNGIQRHEP